MVPSNSPEKGYKSHGLFCSSHGIIKKFAWVSSITKLRSDQRRFYYPIHEGNKWVIQLCPAFEIQKSRESKDIPSSAQGIYRYLRETGEIVYIGRGEILKRLRSPERQNWDFDVIEYSITLNPDIQVKWESYWIEKYKDQNRGKLPFYNKVSGFKQ